MLEFACQCARRQIPREPVMNHYTHCHGHVSWAVLTWHISPCSIDTYTGTWISCHHYLQQNSGNTYFVVTNDRPHGVTWTRKTKRKKGKGKKTSEQCERREEIKWLINYLLVICIGEIYIKFIIKLTGSSCTGFVTSTRLLTQCILCAASGCLKSCF